MWQKCPICNGTGIVEISNYNRKCDTCNGKKIINTLTGLPPEEANEELSKISFYETFKDNRFFKQKE